ncbi:hypothetical protein EW146_g2458 [Bondarzewia mesenterica]|uniref:Uncharacterized protein n=1 Tax=Bondarzewia mesenterica TaxID=1095465 RepID=A0A4S4M2Y7_9AGAM|nr:hypothetical protein EW146_g2458 [Bondarzewia mesenterica]
MPNKTSNRPFLPATSSDFALPSSSSPLSSTSIQSIDEFNPLLFRFRRPSVLAPKHNSDSRLSSPLTTSFTYPLTRSNVEGTANERDKDRMWTDSSPSSSENTTPPLPGSRSEKDTENDSDGNMMKTSHPRTPPRNSSSQSMDAMSEPPERPPPVRRLSHPVRKFPSPLAPVSSVHTPFQQPKLPRILDLVTESRANENEVKSEAQFQRLVASFSELPMQPRTPRAPSDRGRYPEEVGDESQREETPSDDGDDGDFTFAFAPPTSEPISISKPRTPAPQSVNGSVNGDDATIDSPGGITAMDVDVPSSTFGSPSISTPAAHQWRYTPPPTASAVRTNKRKYDDRFDPYPTASKRRAVSPSVSLLRETHSSLSPIYIPRTSASSSRGPIPIPVSAGPSVTSSPTMNGLSRLERPMSVASSPTMRSSMSLASPITRPLNLSRRRPEGEEKEIDGAGDAVGGLSLS